VCVCVCVCERFRTWKLTTHSISVVKYSMVHTFMTSCLPVCLAVISLTAFNCDVNYFTWKYQTVLHFLCSCSYLFTFLLSSQFYWHIHLKSTAYFLTHPVYMSSSLPYHWQHSLPGSLKLLDISHINRILHGTPVFTFQSIISSTLTEPTEPIVPMPLE